MNPPASPSRAIGIIANVVSLLVVLGSFGACMTWGPDKDTHLSDGVQSFLCLSSVVLCLGCGVVSVVVFARTSTDKTKDQATSVAGIVLSIVWALVSTVACLFFWMLEAFRGFGGPGRALRLGGRVVTSEAKPSAEWANGPRPDLTDLDEETRAILRDLWLADACKEHASVPAFGQVAWQLVALGAPSDLVRRAHESALQEIDHAERSFALASTYAGAELGARAMPELHRGSDALPGDRVAALTKVAVEALVDGALLEDYNAELARAALADARDAACRATLATIVRDERAHAELAWDIVAFCIHLGNEPVKRALAKRFTEVPLVPAAFYSPALSARVEAASDEAKALLFAHGRVSAEQYVPVYRTCRRRCEERLRELLLLRDAA